MRRSLRSVTKSRDERERDARAQEFAAIYDAHVDEVYRFVYRRCRDHQLAEDITQEAFLRAVRSAEGPSTIEVGWLMTVARNALYDVIRRETTLGTKLRLVGAAESPMQDADLAERIRVDQAMGKLSVDHRLVLTLHYIDGFTVPALAEQLGRSVKSVEGLVTRARRALREQLTASDPDLRTGGSDD